MKRLFFGICGIAGLYLTWRGCSLIVANVSAHAREAAETAEAGDIAAGYASMFALAGILLPVLGEATWKGQARFVSVITWGAGLLALLVSAGMTADAVASKRSAYADELATVRAERDADTKRIGELRAKLAGMRFEPADADDVKRAERAAERAAGAVKLAADALTAAQGAESDALAAADLECGRSTMPDGSKPRGAGLGPRCTERDKAAETARAATAEARDALAAASGRAADADREAQAVATRAKQTGDRAALQAEIDTLAAKVEAVKPQADPLAQGKILADLYGEEATDANAAKLQRQFLIRSAFGLEVVLLALALATGKLLALALLPAGAAPAASWRDRLRASILARLPRRPAPAEPAGPRLVVSNEAPIGAPAEIVAALLAPGPGIRLAEIGAAYAAECLARGLRVMEPNEAAPLIAGAVQAAGFKVQKKAGGMLAVGAALRARPAKEA